MLVSRIQTSGKRVYQALRPRSYRSTLSSTQMPPELFRHGQHEFVLGERKFDEANLIRDHQARALKFRHLKGFSNCLSVSWIEADSPDIEEATPGQK